MKKLIPAFLLILCLICGIAAAETDTEVFEINWSDYEGLLRENHPGKIVEMDNYNFKYYLPDAFTKADSEGFEFFCTSYGCIYAAKASEFIEGTLDDYAQMLSTDSNLERVTKVLLNGMDAVVCKPTSEHQIAYCYIKSQGGELMTFLYAPVTSANEYAFALSLFAGIQL
ncbi:MAG: hypothetical protein J6B53_13050 [Clostridia bacterium]|nr:hypothetical protein [Clostridia bacterium]